MDDNTAKVLIAAIGVAGGFATGVAVAVVGHLLTSRRERSARWLSDRRRLYARFNATASAVQDEASDRMEDDGRLVDHALAPIDVRAMRLEYEDLRLIAPPSVCEIAAEVFSSLLVLRELAYGDPTDELAEARHDLVQGMGGQWERLFDAMRKDLGIPPTRAPVG